MSEWVSEWVVNLQDGREAALGLEEGGCTPLEDEAGCSNFCVMLSSTRSRAISAAQLSRKKNRRRTQPRIIIANRKPPNSINS